MEVKQDFTKNLRDVTPKSLGWYILTDPELKGRLYPDAEVEFNTLSSGACKVAKLVFTE